MTKVGRVLVGLSIVVGASVVDLSAWGQHGHQIVARIAAQRVKATTKRRMVEILRKGENDIDLKSLLGSPGAPQPSAMAFASALARMATWPDSIPGGKGKTAPWHFIDYGLFEGPETTENRCTQGCVTELISTLISNIKASKSIDITTDDGETVTFGVDKELRFLIHFVGDIHQPLHTITNADAGGNCEKVTGFDGSPKLHSAWDNALVGLIEKPTTSATASALLAEFSSDTTSAQMVDPHTMVSESFALAKDQIYARTKPTTVPVIDHFVEFPPNQCSTLAPAAIRSISVNGPTSFNNAASKKIVRSQLFKAGVRLAAILDSIFE
jgi:nuclease S1